MPGNLVFSQGMFGTSKKREASFGSVLGLISSWITGRCAGAAMGSSSQRLVPLECTARHGAASHRAGKRTAWGCTAVACRRETGCFALRQTAASVVYVLSVRSQAGDV